MHGRQLGARAAHQQRVRLHNLPGWRDPELHHSLREVPALQWGARGDVPADATRAMQQRHDAVPVPAAVAAASVAPAVASPAGTPAVAPAAVAPAVAAAVAAARAARRDLPAIRGGSAHVQRRERRGDYRCAADGYPDWHHGVADGMHRRLNHRHHDRQCCRRLRGLLLDGCAGRHRYRRVWHRQRYGYVQFWRRYGLHQRQHEKWRPRFRVQLRKLPPPFTHASPCKARSRLTPPPSLA